MLWAAILDNSSVYCQKIQMSDPINIRNATDYTLIGNFEKDIFLYLESDSKYKIYSYDTKLNKKSCKTINIDYKNITTVRIFTHKNSFSLLYFFHKSGKTNIHIKKFNALGEETVDFQIGRLNGYHDIKDQQIVLSKNKTNILIYCIINDNQLEIINYNLINQKQNWCKKVSPKGFNYYKDFEDILINNSEEVFIVCNNNNTKRKIKDHTFTIYKIDRGTEINAHIIPFNNYLSTDLSIKFDEKNKQLVMGGLYSTKNTATKGIFYSQIKLNLPTTIHTTELSESLMRSLTGNKKKKIQGIHNFFVFEMILRNDGGALLVAEQRHVFESSGFVSESA